MKTSTRIVEALLGEGTFCPSSGKIISRGPEAIRHVKCPTCGKVVTTEFRRSDGMNVLPDHGKGGKWESVREGAGDSGKTVKISAAERSKMNGAISHLLKEPYFDSQAQAISAINKAIAPVGYFIMATSAYMGGPSGKHLLDIHKENPPGTDMFHGHDVVSNSVLSFAWYKMGSGKYEITAYVS